MLFKRVSSLAVLGAALLAAAQSQTALASEPAWLEAWSWQGFYAGVNAGWGRNIGDLSTGCIDNNGIVSGPFCQIVPGRGTKASGFIGGGQAGYNHQSGRHVFGVEVDFQGADIKGSRTINGPFRYENGGTATPAAQFIAKEHLRWFGTARLRFGHAIAKHTILYGTGGLAFGRYKLASDFVGPNSFTFPAGKHVTKIGWTIGGGIERAFSPNTRLKLEAQYYDLGSEMLSAGCGPGCVTGGGYTRNVRFDLRGAIVRIGINWALGRS